MKPKIPARRRREKLKIKALQEFLDYAATRSFLARLKFAVKIVFKVGM